MYDGPALRVFRQKQGHIIRSRAAIRPHSSATGFPSASTAFVGGILAPTGSLIAVSRVQDIIYIYILSYHNNMILYCARSTLNALHTSATRAFKDCPTNVSYLNVCPTTRTDASRAIINRTRFSNNIYPLVRAERGECSGAAVDI